MRRALSWLQYLWAALRRISGDDAYERYLQHARTHHPGMQPLDARAFYRMELERRWSGINRCC
jgi:uncharacterized short protein YbdD (DUF466 family)